MAKPKLKPQRRRFATAAAEPAAEDSAPEAAPQPQHRCAVPDPDWTVFFVGSNIMLLLTNDAEQAQMAPSDLPSLVVNEYPWRRDRMTWLMLYKDMGAKELWLLRVGQIYPQGQRPTRRGILVADLSAQLETELELNWVVFTRRRGGDDAPGHAPQRVWMSQLAPPAFDRHQMRGLYEFVSYMLSAATPRLWCWGAEDRLRVEPLPTVSMSSVRSQPLMATASTQTGEPAVANIGKTCFQTLLRIRDEMLARRQTVPEPAPAPEPASAPEPVVEPQSQLTFTRLEEVHPDDYEAVEASLENSRARFRQWKEQMARATGQLDG